MAKVVTIRAKVVAIATIWAEGVGRFVLMALAYARIHPRSKPLRGCI